MSDISDATGAPITAPVAAMMAGDRASAALGITVLRAAEGRSLAEMSVRADMVNGHGVIHGGIVFTLADTAFAAACNSFGPLTVASGAEITFVAPAREGEVLSAEAAARTTFGRHGIYDVTVRSGPRVVAEFRGRSSSPRQWQ